ncbi:hypothetical protein ACIQUQ_33350 [Streptomyces sp. NPDC101118]|uniref:hypothetical protein n=1 Tax=Streptomyces sp. NPDC101118 TaxID=3366109 RepID=UPI0037FBD3EF
MIKFYGVLAGSAIAGAVTGWTARALWLWAMAEEQRDCADAVSLCLSLYPFAGMGLWIVLGVPMLLLALWALRVRPLKAAAMGAFALQWFLIAVLAGMSRQELPASAALTIGVLAAGPVLVVLCTDPARRRAGLTAVAILVGVCLFLVWLTVHVNWQNL